MRVKALRGDVPQKVITVNAKVGRQVLSDIENASRDFQILSLVKILDALDSDIWAILEIKKPAWHKDPDHEIVHEQLDAVLTADANHETAIAGLVDAHYKLLKPR